MPASRRLVCVLAVLLTLGYVALLGVPASAHLPVGHQMLNPEEFNGDGGLGFAVHGADDGALNGDQAAGMETKESEILSDALNTAFTFRSVTTPETMSYSFLDCPVGGDPFTAGVCAVAAVDATPTLSTPPAGVMQVAVFEGAYDIPAMSEGSRDVVGVACIEGPAIDAAHCTAVTVSTVHMDDSATVADHAAVTDGGLIIQPSHADQVNRGGFTAVAHTTPGDMGAGIYFCVDPGTNATTPDDQAPDPGGGTGCDPSSMGDTTPNDGAAGTPCDPAGVPAGVSCWSADIDPPDAAEFALSIIEYDPTASPALTDDISSGNGDCEGDTNDVDLIGPDEPDGDDCQLDKIVLTSGEEAAAQVHAHNDETRQPAEPGNDAGNDADADDGPTLCQNADRKKTGAVAAEAHDELLGCVFDELADPDADGNKDITHDMAVEATWALSGGGATFGALPSTVSGWCKGTGGGGDATNGTHDHDGDGIFEHCHFQAADPDDVGGVLLYEGEWVQAQVGQVTATFCVDPEQATSADPNHGCADAGALQDSVTKNEPPVAAVDHDHLKLAADVDADPTCATGNATVQAQEGTNVNVTGCSQDAAHAGLPGLGTFWGLAGPGSFGASAAVTDPQGQADATVTAPAGSAGQTTTVSYCADDNNDDACDSGAAPATLAIMWTAAPPTECPGFEGDPRNHVVGTDADETLTGTDGDDIICAMGGDDTLNGLGGDDLLLGGDGDDTANGGEGRDNLLGGAGNDVLRGHAGNDDLRGGNGHDELVGGSGNDELRGGKGRDELNGRGGRDLCRGGKNRDETRRCET